MLYLDTYGPNDIVRVTIVIDDNSDRENVINELKEFMKDESSFHIHNPKLNNYTFTIELKYSLVDSLNEVKGIKTFELTQQVGLHQNNTGSEETIQQELIKPGKPQETKVSMKLEYTAIGLIVLCIVISLGLVRFKKK